MCRFVGTVPDIGGLVGPSFTSKSGLKSKIPGRILKSFEGPCSSAESRASGSAAAGSRLHAARLRAARLQVADCKGMLHCSMNSFRFLCCLLWFVLGAGSHREAPGSPGNAHGPPRARVRKPKNPYLLQGSFKRPRFCGHRAQHQCPHSGEICILLHFEFQKPFHPQHVQGACWG